MDSIPLMYTKKTGYVGRESVTAFIYPGSDSGLSHYKFQGKTFVGTVEFSSVESVEQIIY